MIKSAIVRMDIVLGDEIVVRGHECARQLWNHLCWCGFGFNRKFQRRDKWLGMKYKEKWPGRFGLDKAFRDHWAAVELSDRCYSTVVQQFDIAVRSWFSNLKSNPKARPPRYCPDPRPLFFEVGRNAKTLKSWQFRLTVLGGHIKNRHAIIKLSMRPGIKMSNVETITLQPSGKATITYSIEAKESLGNKTAALDLGIINLGCLAFDNGDSILYSGKGILASDQGFAKKEARCKPSGWQGKGYAESKQSKHKIAYRVKAGNIRRLAIHNFTRHVINECGKRSVGTLAVGDLRGIRKNKDFGKAGNQKFHAWPFAEIRRQLEYKGKELGIGVIAVSERNTSRTCHVCGVIDKSSRVYRGLYQCKHCGTVLNADLNGAFNILNKVSPVPIRIGVEGFFAALPSLIESASGIGETPQIHPTFVAKYDLRGWVLQSSVVATKGSGNRANDYKS